MFDLIVIAIIRIVLLIFIIHDGYNIIKMNNKIIKMDNKYPLVKHSLILYNFRFWISILLIIIMEIYLN